MIQHTSSSKRSLNGGDEPINLSTLYSFSSSSSYNDQLTLNSSAIGIPMQTFTNTTDGNTTTTTTTFCASTDHTTRTSRNSSAIGVPMTFSSTASLLLNHTKTSRCTSIGIGISNHSSSQLFAACSSGVGIYDHEMLRSGTNSSDTLSRCQLLEDNDLLPDIFEEEHFKRKKRKEKIIFLK